MGYQNKGIGINDRTKVNGNFNENANIRFNLCPPVMHDLNIYVLRSE